MSLVYVKGVNPDLLRRDQDPYREAVVVGGAKLPRRCSTPLKRRIPSSHHSQADALARPGAPEGMGPNSARFPLG